MRFFSEETVKRIITDTVNATLHIVKPSGDYPYIEIPDNHGRLGDLDALAEHIRNVYCNVCKRSKVMCKACEYGDILDEIEEAPTVLEASK